jgi:hypothetical protein
VRFQEHIYALEVFSLKDISRFDIAVEDDDLCEKEFLRADCFFDVFVFTYLMRTRGRGQVLHVERNSGSDAHFAGQRL